MRITTPPPDARCTETTFRLTMAGIGTTLRCSRTAIIALTADGDAARPLPTPTLLCADHAAHVVKMIAEAMRTRLNRETTTQETAR